MAGKDRQRRVAGAHRMVLLSQRCTEHRHDAIAHHAVDGAPVLADRRDHDLDGAIQDDARGLGVDLLDQAQRPPNVREENSDSLVLAFDAHPK